MKCIKCGYESPAQFSQCPMCGTFQYTQQPVSQYASPVPSNSGRMTGELAAVFVAIGVAVCSIIAAFIIFFAFVENVASKRLQNQDDEFGIDAFDDEDSNDFGELEDFFKKYYGGDSSYNSESPAGLNTPIKFSETLYSFSAGEIDTEFEVTMTATYRGDAALKLLEGATLPEYNKETQEIFVARFNVRITEQEKEALVPLPFASPAAYPSNKTSIFSAGYDYLGNLPYANRYKLVKKDEITETWLAFVTDKEDKKPCVRWKLTEDKVFQNTEDALEDASLVEAGAALDQTENSADSVQSSDENASSN